METREKPTLLAEMLAEFLGTLVLILLGDGVVAMVVLFGKDVPPGGVTMGGYTNITLGWGLAVFMGICVAGRTSGAHLNPAVTLAMALFRGFSWVKVLPYSLAQVAGAFVGAALVFLNYRAAFRHFDPELATTAGVFATFPPPFVTEWLPGFIDQVIGTALLVGLILAITDPDNEPVAPSMQPFAIALVVVAIGISWGGMHGYAINPARDVGPRLFTEVAGFQKTGFESSAWWVAIAGPLAGGVVGALVFDLLVKPFLPRREVGK